MEEKKLTEIDRLYFPHCWTKRLPFDQVLENHIEFFNNNSEKVKKDVKCEFNVPYGFSPREKYDILGIDLPDDSPIFIHIHGGYWQVKEITHSNQAFLATSLHKHNIKVINIGYEMCPEVTIPYIMKEIEIAFRRCLDYAKKYKSKGVFMSGHSVGAQLVACLFTNLVNLLPKDDQKLIKVVYLNCGLYDVLPITKTVIGEQLKLDEETAREISPQHNTVTSPPHVNFHVITADHDSPAFRDQGEKFHQKLVDGGLNSEYHLLKETDHFDAVEKIIDENSDVCQLILEAAKGITC